MTNPPDSRSPDAPSGETHDDGRDAKPVVSAALSGVIAAVYERPGGGIIVTGTPPQDDDEETGHNCDAMGCGWEHVLYRSDKPSVSSSAPSGEKVNACEDCDGRGEHVSHDPCGATYHSRCRTCDGSGVACGKIATSNEVEDLPHKPAPSGETLPEWAYHGEPEVLTHAEASDLIFRLREVILTQRAELARVTEERETYRRGWMAAEKAQLEACTELARLQRDREEEISAEREACYRAVEGAYLALDNDPSDVEKSHNRAISEALLAISRRAGFRSPASTPTGTTEPDFASTLMNCPDCGEFRGHGHQCSTPAGTTNG